MGETQYDVVIVGAGLAGLTAALESESKGLKTLILEGSDRIGGRVRTDEIDGFLLDRGFQVLIDSYEKAREILDYSKLNLKRFAPGAKIFDEKGSFRIADPLRVPSATFSTLFSRVGTLKDKWKLYQLTKSLQKEKLNDLFPDDHQTTRHFLESYGFSNQIIERFFTPFFGGIFLERELTTSVNMFRFVFRNFSNGDACIPENGMGKIPEQLASRLSKTDIRLNQMVNSISQAPSVVISTGEEIRCKKLIIATNPDNLLGQISDPQEWKSTTTMYFSGSMSLPGMSRLIGLDARKKSSINNFARHDEISQSCVPKGKSLWSVTTRGDQKPRVVLKDLADLLGVSTGELNHLKTYQIPRALPVVKLPKLSVPAEQTQITSHIHLAGDYLTNASIDGAMRAGQEAGIAVSETLEATSQAGLA